MVVPDLMSRVAITHSSDLPVLDVYRDVGATSTHPPGM